MAHGIEEVSIRQAAFRSCATGAVVLTGPCHDITRLPGGLDADLDEWQAGFTDASGRFMDRQEAAAAAPRPSRERNAQRSSPHRPARGPPRRAARRTP